MLEIRDLTKRYGDVVSLGGSVAPGRISGPFCADRLSCRPSQGAIKTYGDRRSVRGACTEEGAVADPQSRGCGEQHGERVQAGRIRGPLLGEKRERVLHRPDRKTVVLHFVHYILQLVSLDHRLTLSEPEVVEEVLHGVDPRPV